MIAQVLFFNNFSEKDPHLNAVEHLKVMAMANQSTRKVYKYGSFL